MHRKNEEENQASEPWSSQMAMFCYLNQKENKSSPQEYFGVSYWVVSLPISPCFSFLLVSSHCLSLDPLLSGLEPECTVMASYSQLRLPIHRTAAW